MAPEILIPRAAADTTVDPAEALADTRAVLPNRLAAGVAPLLITVRQAAAALAVSEKTLWTLTNRGDLPCVRIGRSVRYAVDDLRAWIAKQRQ